MCQASMVKNPPTFNRNVNIISMINTIASQVVEIGSKTG
jgi:hypothetical protein